MVAINFVSGNQLLTGVIILKIVNLAGLAGVVWYVYRISGKQWLAWVVAANPVVLLNSVATPHTDIVLAALLLGAYYQSRTWMRGGLLGAAGLIKPHMLVFLPFLAKTWRGVLALGSATVLALGVLLLVLKPVVGFDWLPMLAAGQGGGVLGMESLLMTWLLPKAPPHTVFLASYVLFAACYGVILWLYCRRRLRQMPALAAAGLLVPLCLTGVLLPWHFVIPIVLLLICESRAPVLLALAFTALVMRSAQAVPQLLAILALLWAAYELGRWVYQGVSKRPPWAVRLAESIKL
jgi:hypothetical protein